MSTFATPQIVYTPGDENVSENEKNLFIDEMGAARDAKVVHLDITETIKGVKTFQQAPYSDLAATQDHHLVRLQEFNPVANQVTTNEGDIETNAGNITTNANNITTNTGNISDNAGNITTNTNDIAPLKRETFWIGQGSNDNVQINAATKDASTVSIKANSVWAGFYKHDNIVTFDFQCYINTTSQGTVNEIVLDISWVGELTLPNHPIPINMDIDNGRG